MTYRLPDAFDDYERILRPELLETFEQGVKEYQLDSFSFSSFTRGALLLMADRLKSGGIMPSIERFREILAEAPSQDLVLKIAFESGDQFEVIEALYRVHSKYITRLYVHFGARTSQALECMNELIESTVFGAFRKSSSPALLNYGARSEIRTWLYAVARNDWKNRERKSSTRSAISGNLHSDENIAPEGEEESAQVLEAHCNEVANCLFLTLKQVAKSGRIKDRYLLVYCLTILSEKPQSFLANRLRIDPGQFSRIKRGAEKALISEAKDFLDGLLTTEELEHLASSIDVRKSGLSNVVHRFARWYLQERNRSQGIG